MEAVLRSYPSRSSSQDRAPVPSPLLKLEVSFEMAKPGFKTVTIKESTLKTLEEIAPQINKSVPETITELANLFRRYVVFLKVLEGSSPPKTEDMIALIEQIKLQSQSDAERSKGG